MSSQSPSEPAPESPDLETLKSQLAEAQQLLQDYQNKVSALQAQLQQVTAHRDELQKALAQLQAVAEERAKTIQELQSRRGQVAPLPKPQPQPSPLHAQKKIMNRPIFDNVSPTDEDMPPYMLD
jgi:septal ring factor EnvC (AmiA/AmiB activator)